ncbi:hypothetical protein RZS08_59260, partial [Arthrospira platensis SPKY1]|nr:hypothetical protein [Arthrospira platensis SPKY1]
YALTINNDFVADGTLSYLITATAGEGYHFSGWRRSTNGGIAYGNLLPLAGSGVVGLDFAPQNFIFDADQLKPTNCSQIIAYRADFDFNKYNVVTSSSGPV